MSKKEHAKAGAPGKALTTHAMAPPPVYVESGQDGLENLRPQDLVLPRLVLLQQLTPSVVEKRHESGQVLNSLTSEIVLGNDETIEFVPILHYLEWIEWGDRELKEGVLARSVDSKSELAMRSQNGEQKEVRGRKVRAVTEYHNFVVIFPSRDINQMTVISCARTNYKKGRKLIALARYRGAYPLYAGKYALTTRLEKNAQGQYYVFDFENAGWATKDVYDAAKSLYANIRRAKAITVDREKEGDEATDAVDPEL